MSKIVKLFPESKNGKKRNRENGGSSPNHKSNGNKSPPPKKRRLSVKHKKSRNKDLSKWTLVQLKKYLNDNGLSYQIGKDKPYYHRLVALHKKNAQNKAKKIVKNGSNSPKKPIKEQSEPMQVEESVDETSESSSMSSTNATEMNGNQSESPKESEDDFSFQIPSRKTPPLPSILCKTPLTIDRFDSEASDLSQTNLSQNKPRSNEEEEALTPTAPVRKKKSVQFATPPTSKSEALIDQLTPLKNNKNAIVISSDDESESEEENENENEREPLRNYQQIQPQTQSQTMQQSVLSAVDPMDNDEKSGETQQRLGPFQDVPSFKNMFKFENYSIPSMPMPTIPKMKLSEIRSVKMPSFRSENAYLTYLFCAIGIILTAMCIPYFVSLFVPTPFCDNNLEEIKGSYAVFDGIIPLENLMKCRQCPFDAQCNDGKATCDDGFILDYFGVQCLAKTNDEISSNAALVAHRVSSYICIHFMMFFVLCFQVNIALGLRYGESQCGMLNGSSYIMREDELKTMIKAHFVVNDTIESNENEKIRISGNEFDESWNYAKDNILPNGYAQTVKINEDNGNYVALRPIPPSIWCRSLYLYREYIRSEQLMEHLDILCGFAALFCCVLIGICLKTRAKKPDPDAIEAANFVLEKLSHFKSVSFSMGQFKHYTMNRKNIDEDTWEEAVKYVNESSSVDIVTEDIDGNVRTCWKWKAPVPFIPLN